MKKVIVFLFFVVFILTCITIKADDTNWKEHWEWYINGLRNAVSYEELPFKYDFEVERLRYTIISKEEQTVSVRASYYAYGFGTGLVWIGETTDTSLVGNIIIPSHVTHNGTVYTVTTIGKNAFFGNPFITSITIPSTITDICEDAFCDSYIQRFYLYTENLCQVGDFAFSSPIYVDGKSINIINRECYCYSMAPPIAFVFLCDERNICDGLLHVPVGCKEAYQQAEGWKQYGENIVDDIELNGIHSSQVISNDSYAPTYDLHGRRVAHPKQGRIYIQGRKKVKR